MLRGHASPSAHAASKDRLPSQRFFIRRQLNKSNQGLCTAHATMEEAGERASEGVHFLGRGRRIPVIECPQPLFADAREILFWS